LICHIFEDSILFYLLEKLIELRDESNELNKLNEIKLCSILDFNFYYNKKDTIKSKMNFISFFMLNEETLLKNFNFIKNELINDILINYSIFELQNIVYLLDKHLIVLLREHKQDLIQILSILFKNIAIQLINFDKDIRMIPSHQQLKDKIIQMMKNIQRESTLINNNDKKNLFSGLNELNLILNDEHVKWCVFEEHNKYMRIDHRLDYLVQILKIGNYYSENTLDQIYNFSILTFSLFHENSSNCKYSVQKLIRLVNIMSIFSHFDYTSSENYLKYFELFANLNNEIYNKILRDSISTANLIVYVESLISLNLFVENAFNDLIIRGNEKGVINFLVKVKS